MPFGYPFYLWLKNNPAAQWALGIGAGLAVFWSWLSLRDIRIRREATAKLRNKIEQAQDKHEEKVHEAEVRITERIDIDGLRDVASRDPANRGAVRLD